MANKSIKEIFYDSIGPLLTIFKSFQQTFQPYKNKEEFKFLDQSGENLYGDLLTPIYGLLDLFRGVVHIIIGLVNLFPLTMFIRPLIEYLKHHNFSPSQKEDDFALPETGYWELLKTQNKNMLGYLIGGSSCILKGAIELMIMTPLLIIRIPLRLIITTYNDYKQHGPYHKTNENKFSSEEESSTEEESSAQAEKTNEKTNENATEKTTGKTTGKTTEHENFGSPLDDKDDKGNAANLEGTNPEVVTDPESNNNKPAI